MTLYRTLAVGCDWTDCDSEYEGFPGQPAKVVRAEAKFRGWRRRAGQDYCPIHEATYHFRASASVAPDTWRTNGPAEATEEETDAGT